MNPDENAPINPQWRPKFHFSPPTGWMNDPNGLVFHDGLWHLFYQWAPDPRGGPKHWGHAVSSDLFHWEHWPLALEPDELGEIWSGSAVSDGERLILCFTHRNEVRQAQSLAFSHDGGRTFQKFAANPILTSECADFRDPKLFRWQNEWRMLVAAGADLQIFGATDLQKWRLLSQFPAPQNGWIWECPDLFFLDGHWILLASVIVPNAPHQTLYWLGAFDGATFQPTTEAQKLSFGPDDYAAISFANAPDNRRLILGWMNSWAYVYETPNFGARGAMTLPRELSIRDGKLRQNPAREIENFRGDAIYLEELKVNDQVGKDEFQRHEVEVPGSPCEFEMEVEANGEQVYLDLVFGGGEPVGLVFYDDGAEREFNLYRDDVGRARCFGDFTCTTADVQSSDGLVKLHMVIDACSVEIFVNDGQNYAAMLIFPDAPLQKIQFSHLDCKKATSRLLRCVIYPLDF